VAVVALCSARRQRGAAPLQSCSTTATSVVPRPLDASLAPCSHPSPSPDAVLAHPLLLSIFTTSCVSWYMRCRCKDYAFSSAASSLVGTIIARLHTLKGA
jgi:hypothetical protein